jgi:hypothetical protein
MNEQIRKFVKRAGGHFSTRNLTSNPPQQVEFVELCDDKIEKFAELLIEVCVDWIDNNVGYIDEPAREDLFKHLGIKR